MFSSHCIRIRFAMLLRLTPGHACGVINVVAEFTVDVARIDARPTVCPITYLGVCVHF
jgi:hypothetical protein